MPYCVFLQYTSYAFQSVSVNIATVTFFVAELGVDEAKRPGYSPVGLSSVFLNTIDK